MNDAEATTQPLAAAREACNARGSPCDEPVVSRKMPGPAAKLPHTGTPNDPARAIGSRPGFSRRAGV
jgi:hypothetical protein